LLAEGDVAANGIEVLSALKRYSYDIVLMDTEMPKMNGLEAARIILELKPLKNIHNSLDVFFYSIKFA